MTIGPLMLDLRSIHLEADEIDILQHPMVGGIILFSRNYESPEQIRELTQSIHDASDNRLLIAVDQEGGRVQRFRKGFTSLPPCRTFGEAYDKDPKYALEITKQAGWLMAAELIASGIDFSFAPVLDLYKGISQVIGDRAFHSDPQVTTTLAKQYISGMRKAGMASVGKHFPGHGAVAEDSHVAIPKDNRRFEDIQMDDLITFENLINSNISAIMPAHIIYPNIDSMPVGLSEIWLKQILRKQLNFKGAIFSDDLSMAGAEIAGNFLSRTYAALNAGCDMVLICNQQEQAVNVLDNLSYDIDPTSSIRLMRMQSKPSMNFKQLCCTKEWDNANKRLSQLVITPELDLGDDQIS